MLCERLEENFSFQCSCLVGRKLYFVRYESVWFFDCDRKCLQKFTHWNRKERVAMFSVLCEDKMVMFHKDVVNIRKLGVTICDFVVEECVPVSLFCDAKPMYFVFEEVCVHYIEVIKHIVICGRFRSGATRFQIYMLDPSNWLWTSHVAPSGARFNPYATTSCTHDTIYFFGGTDNVYSETDDLMFLRFQGMNSTWGRITGGRDLPTRRFRNSMCTVGSRLFVYGGGYSHVFCSYLDVFDISDTKWKKVGDGTDEALLSLTGDNSIMSRMTSGMTSYKLTRISEKEILVLNEPNLVFSIRSLV